MLTTLTIFLVFIFVIIISPRISIDPIVIAYAIGAILSVLLGPFEQSIVGIFLGTSLAIGFPLLVMGADVGDLTNITSEEVIMMTFYALFVSTSTVLFINYFDFSRDVEIQSILISSSFIGSSPNMFLSAAILDVKPEIQVKSQIMDWIGSSVLFCTLMTLARKDPETDLSPKQQNRRHLSANVGFRAVSIGLCCLVARMSLTGYWYCDLFVLFFLVVLSVLMSLSVDETERPAAIKMSSYAFTVYGASVGLLLDKEKVLSLSAPEVLYPVILVFSSIALLAVAVRIFGKKNELLFTVLSSSVLSPMVAALVISRVYGTPSVASSLRLSVLGLLTASFYTISIAWILGFL